VPDRDVRSAHTLPLASGSRRREQSDHPRSTPECELVSAETALASEGPGPSPSGHTHISPGVQCGGLFNRSGLPPNREDVLGEPTTPTPWIPDNGDQE
jgi:hypothetical protein